LEAAGTSRKSRATITAQNENCRIAGLTPELDPEDELKLKDIQASVRCLVPDEAGGMGKCIVSGKDTPTKE